MDLEEVTGREKSNNIRKIRIFRIPAEVNRRSVNTENFEGIAREITERMPYLNKCLNVTM